MASVKARLKSLSGNLKELARQESAETIEQQQIRAADEALSAIQRLRQLSEQDAQADADHVAALVALQRSTIAPIRRAPPPGAAPAAAPAPGIS